MIRTGIVLTDTLGLSPGQHTEYTPRCETDRRDGGVYYRRLGEAVLKANSVRSCHCGPCRGTGRPSQEPTRAQQRSDLALGDDGVS